MFFFVLYFLFFNPFESISQNDKFIVVLDAGHGGNDPGNTGNGYREKNIVLKVVKEIQLELKKIEGIKVILTRDEDMLINLWKRGEIANKAKANYLFLFIVMLIPPMHMVQVLLFWGFMQIKEILK